jgi:translation initiation factor 2 subunit 2
MDYGELLDKAYDIVKPCEEVGRFEILKVTGHHEGSRTVITNFGQVASCIRRDPEHLAKFLFKELATSGNIRGDRLVLDKKDSSKNVNDKVEKYVNHFVLCPSCKKPDTELVEEDDRLILRCLACGNKKEIHN